MRKIRELLTAALALFVFGLGFVNQANAQENNDNWASNITLGAGMECSSTSYEFRDTND